jgi:O-antigen/teichoic acid export membrane protein
VEIASSLAWLALAAVWISAGAAVFQGALEGAQHYGLRSAGIILSQLVFLAVVWLEISVFDELVLGVASISQAAAMFLVMLAGAWLRIPGVRQLRLRWERRKFKEVIAYGVNLQGIALLVALLDPVAKSLVGHFGGLSAAGYMDMANKLVSQMRTMMVGAIQVIVPDMARLRDRAMISRLYREAFIANGAVSACGSTFLMIAAPIISELWLGRNEPMFIFSLYTIAFAGWINLLSGPAYFVNVGTGHVRRNVVGHLAMVFANLTLGWVLGTFWGGYGAVMAYAGALVSGGLVMIFLFHRAEGSFFVCCVPERRVPMRYGLVLVSWVAAWILMERSSGAVETRATAFVLWCVGSFLMLIDVLSLRRKRVLQA